MPGRFKWLLFALMALLIVLGLSLLWPFVAPLYNSLLARTAGLVAPFTFVPLPGNNLIVIMGSAHGNLVITSLPYQGGLVLVLALIAVTPAMKFFSRLKAICYALTLTFTLHVITLAVLAANAHNGQPLVILFASLGVDLFPILIWALLSKKYWWPDSKITVKENYLLSDA